MPNAGASTIDFMNAIYTIMQSNLEGYNLWQLDGRPMSGDIGRGATRETVSFAVDLTSVPDRPLGKHSLLVIIFEQYLWQYYCSNFLSLFCCTIVWKAFISWLVAPTYTL
uniref:Iron-sulphur binding protein LdpA C-terminal domain-containing protein n=1 Tax=Aegilops tauschii subsp. strangulata TaxID=200361 RepID=A0A452Y2U2_AEGTS